MAFLIRTIAIAKSGREIIRDRTVESAGLVVGRSPDSDIHLPDLTVELQHVSIADAGGGMIEAKALGELPFDLNGSTVNEKVRSIPMQAPRSRWARLNWRSLARAMDLSRSSSAKLKNPLVLPTRLPDLR